MAWNILIERSANHHWTSTVLNRQQKVKHLSSCCYNLIKAQEQRRVSRAKVGKKKKKKKVSEHQSVGLNLIILSQETKALVSFLISRNMNLFNFDNPPVFQHFSFDCIESPKCFRSLVITVVIIEDSVCKCTFCIKLCILKQCCSSHSTEKYWNVLVLLWIYR